MSKIMTKTISVVDNTQEFDRQISEFCKSHTVSAQQTHVTPINTFDCDKGDGQMRNRIMYTAMIYYIDCEGKSPTTP